MQQGEMFVMNPDSESPNSIENISNVLYRIQKLSSSYYVFRHHLETQLVDDQNAQKAGRYIRIQSMNALISLHPKKVKISKLGEPEYD
jgi:CRISPR-associated endonuclease Csn1